MAGRLMRPRRILSRKMKSVSVAAAERGGGGRDIQFYTGIQNTVFLLLLSTSYPGTRKEAKTSHDQALTERAATYTLSYSVSLSLRCKMLLSFGSGSSH